MILAAVAGEDFVVAVAVDVGQPESMAVSQRFIEHGAAAGRAEAFPAIIARDDRSQVNGDAVAVPGLDRRQETPAVCPPSGVDFTGPALGRGGVAIGKRERLRR